ncbi:hypothetical protein [Streptomyces adustus]|uniref:hypothetical protein n=1 Tax=Streptomyces adustus TaxID=1609272 RepID=UPI0012E0A4A8|nr:hypothetical protein [Streptomyces adustus]
MTTDDSGVTSEATFEEYLTLINELLAQPFPETSFSDVDGYGGPGHRVGYLHVSQEFWDDEDGQAWREVEARLRACLDALAAALTERWGDPLAVDLWSCLKDVCAGETVPEPLRSLCQSAVSLQAWPLRDRDRWIGLALGQDDKELPLVLYATVGRTSATWMGQKVYA